MDLKEFERLDDLGINNLYIIQSEREYLFTSDAVALANFVCPKLNARLIDLCSGSGVIGILVNAKNNIHSVTCVEIQKNLADMCSRTIEYNNIDNINVINAPIQNIYKVLGGGYDVVVCNPPYKKLGTSRELNEAENIAIAKHEIKVTLEEIISESNKLLKFGGDLYIMNKEDRLVDMICILREYNLEPKEMKILKSDKGNSVVMIKARKGGKSGIKVSLN